MTNEIVMQFSKQATQLEQFIQAYPFIIFVAALVFLGRLIKSSAIPNVWIPWILCVTGAVVVPFIADTVPVVKDLNEIMKISTGFCMGFISCGLFEAVIRLPFVRNSEFCSKVLGFEISKKTDFQ